jgi:uncharacterized protein
MSDATALDPLERMRLRDEQAPLLTPVEKRLVERLAGEQHRGVDAPGAMPFLTLIVKGTRLCNLRCQYCHDWRTGRDQRMPFNVLAHVVARALGDPAHRVVNFIWHGGETTVLPIAFYERALLLQSRFRQPGQTVRNSIQTNGTRITADWARFLRANEIAVGVSIDGPREIHDKTRRYASGRGSFDDVLRGLSLLEEHGVDHSVLMVIDEEAYSLGPEAIFSFFAEHRIKSFGLLAAKPTNQPDAAPLTPAEHYVDPTRFMRFLAKLSDIRGEHGDRAIQIRELDVLERRIAGTKHRPCTLAGNCLGGYFLVEPNGDVAHCDLFLGDPAYTLGNVVRNTFAEIRTSEPLQALQRSNEQALAKLRVCPEFEVCNGWCPHERYASVRHNPHHSDECCGLKGLIAHLRRSPLTVEAAGEEAPT